MFPTGRTASFGLLVCQPHNLSSFRNLGGITISRFASLPSNSIRIKTPISDGFNYHHGPGLIITIRIKTTITISRFASFPLD
jgi:hypothetical protein